MGPAAAYLERGELLGETAEPAFGGNHEGGVVGADGSCGFGVSEEPGGQAAEIPLGAGVRAGAEDDIKAFLLGGADEGGDVVLAGEVVVPGRRLMDVPEDIGGDGVEAHGLRHLEAGVPVLAGDAGVVEFAGEDLIGVAVESEVVGLDGEAMRLGWRLDGQDGGAEKEECLHCSIGELFPDRVTIA